MPNDAYIITIWITIGISFLFCLFFSILSIPQTSHLHNYRVARYVMACAYLSLGLMNIIELCTLPEMMDVRSTRMIALLACLLQSFLFTYTNITLINLHFATKQNILLESIPIILFCILTPVVLSTSLAIYIDFLFYIFIVYYISALIRYTLLFHGNYNQYIRKMENFYAGQEAKRFHWIYISFYMALIIGILALFVTLFFSHTAGIIFSLIIIGFYSYYGIQFINYAYSFQHIETVMADNKEVQEKTGDISTFHHFFSLKQDTEQWIVEKKFLYHNINIENVASQLGTNRSYLSGYINSCLRITFKEWISGLRIEEAKNLLLQYPDVPIAEISEMAGFSDKSNFGRIFTKHTGLSPKIWRTSKINHLIS